MMLNSPGSKSEPLMSHWLIPEIYNGPTILSMPMPMPMPMPMLIPPMSLAAVHMTLSTAAASENRANDEYPNRNND
jgi:hypothetical protein